VVLGVAAALAGGCEPGGLLAAGPDGEQRAVPAGTLDPAAAVQGLAALPVAPPGAMTGYDRDCGQGQGCVFGPAWSDDVAVAGGHNGCDTRNDMLDRDVRAGQVNGVPVPKRFREPGRCVVIEGVLAEPYTGVTVHFTKEYAGDVQVDHVVPLAAAWRAGAAGWPAQRRRDFANDPRNLLVVDASTNQSKGDSTAEEWLPPDAGFRCEYARIMVTVKSAYGLAVTQPERAALQSALDSCLPPAPATTPALTATPAG
jgi:hypothetical protein